MPWRKSCSLFIVGVGLALSGAGCFAAVPPPPSAYVEDEALPPDITMYPQAYYDGHPVYLYHDRWYYRHDRHWRYYHEPPRELRTYRAPPAYRYPPSYHHEHERRGRRHEEEEHRQQAPPATRVR